MNAACPAMADVDGVRYAVSGAQDLVDVEELLVPGGTIDVTNADGYLADRNVFAIAGIAPRALLVARANESLTDPGDYILLWGPDGAAAWPHMCRRLTRDMRAAQPECQ